MKEKILDISKKLYHNHLTPETATNLLLDLFAVSGSVCHCDKLPDGEIAISSKALQKPYGDLGQTDC
jgi:hypothetical protein